MCVGDDGYMCGDVGTWVVMWVCLEECRSALLLCTRLVYGNLILYHTQQIPSLPPSPTTYASPTTYLPPHTPYSWSKQKHKKQPVP